jgi:hypothetical protein
MVTDTLCVRRCATTSNVVGPCFLPAASLKLILSTRWFERKGLLPMALWYEDSALIGAGADPDGTLDMHQYQ